MDLGLLATGKAFPRHRDRDEQQPDERARNPGTGDEEVVKIARCHEDSLVDDPADRSRTPWPAEHENRWSELPPCW
jgi:hypothetical protein